MDRDGIIQKVLSNIDELSPFDAGLVVSVGNENVNPFEETIDSVLDENSTQFLILAPLSVIKMKVLPGIVIENNVGTVPFPADFVKLGFVQFPCWTGTVCEYAKLHTDDYDKNTNKYATGGIAKPSAVEVILLDNKKGLVFSKVTDDDNGGGDFQFYVSVTLPEELEDSLIPAFTWMVASNVLLIFEKTTEAKSASEKFIGMMSALEPNKTY